MSWFEINELGLNSNLKYIKSTTKVPMKVIVANNDISY